MEESFNTLDRFMRTQIALRKREIRENLDLGDSLRSDRRDVFSLLMKANENVGEKYPLDDNELVRIRFHILVLPKLYGPLVRQCVCSSLYRTWSNLLLFVC